MKTLKEIENEIMIGRISTLEGWRQLSRDTDAAMLQASETEIESFVDSGAGEILDMICLGFGLTNDS